MKHVLILSVLLGIGLLTKGTFLAFVPALAVFVWIMQRRHNPHRALSRSAAFLALAAIVGCYKYVENQMHYGGPVIHNLDLQHEWGISQTGTYTGVRSLVDFDIVKLLRSPRLSEQTAHSIPLLMYGTLWYSHIRESSFQSPASAAYVAPALYLLGLAPTALLIAGWWMLWMTRPGGDRELASFDRLAAALLGLNLALVIALGLRYDVWSCFQSRLLFPSMAGIVLSLATGLEFVWRRWPAPLRAIVLLNLVCLFMAFVTYYAVEIACRDPVRSKRFGPGPVPDQVTSIQSRRDVTCPASV
jgi:hypothetical protein